MLRKRTKVSFSYGFTSSSLHVWLGGRRSASTRVTASSAEGSAMASEHYALTSRLVCGVTFACLFAGVTLLSYAELLAPSKRDGQHQQRPTRPRKQPAPRASKVNVAWAQQQQQQQQQMQRQQQQKQPQQQRKQQQKQVAIGPPQCGGVVPRRDYSLALGAVMQSARRRHASTKISDCVNLAPAGTGTRTLYKRLQQYAPRRAHHSHWRTAAFLHSYKRHVSSPPRCFVVTLRDPAERWKTAWSFLEQQSGIYLPYGQQQQVSLMCCSSYRCLTAALHELTSGGSIP